MGTNDDVAALQAQVELLTEERTKYLLAAEAWNAEATRYREAVHEVLELADLYDDQAKEQLAYGNNEAAAVLGVQAKGIRDAIDRKLR